MGGVGRLSVVVVVVVGMPLNPGVGHTTEVGGVEDGEEDRDQRSVIAGSGNGSTPPPLPVSMLAMAAAEVMVEEAGRMWN